MLIKLRKKSQVTIPKEFVAQLNLQEGDHLEISIKDGALILTPVAIYSKSYIQKLEDTVMKVSSDSSKYNIGPFKTVEDAIDYLEESDENNDSTDKDNK